jgi:hypothetical protein
MGARVVAIVLLADGPAIHARNASRPGRVVPADIVDRHLAALGRLGDGPDAIRAALTLEGFAGVHLVDGSGPPPSIERRPVTLAP